MSTLTEKTLHAIAEKNIQPLPLWHSQLKNGGFWTGTFLLVFLAALATALCLHSILEIDWDASVRAHFSFTEMFFLGVPIVMSLFLLLFLAGSIVSLHETRYGYRYSLLSLFGGFLLISSVLGFGIEALPFDESVDRFLTQPVRRAEQWGPRLLPSADEQWSRPEKGLLGGTILSSSSNDVELLDAHDQQWTVKYSQEAVGQNVRLIPKEEVKVIGTKEGDHVFQAREIREWKQSSPQKNTWQDRFEKNQSREHE